MCISDCFSAETLWLGYLSVSVDVMNKVLLLFYCWDREGSHASCCSWLVYKPPECTSLQKANMRQEKHNDQPLHYLGIPLYQTDRLYNRLSGHYFYSSDISDLTQYTPIIRKIQSIQHARFDWHKTSWVRLNSIENICKCKRIRVLHNALLKLYILITKILIFKIRSTKG